jgi:hypothetical protein
MLVLCVGMADGQNAAHDVDNAATEADHSVKHATKKVGKATRLASKMLVTEPRSPAKDAGKDVETGTEKTGDSVNGAVTK